MSSPDRREFGDAQRFRLDKRAVRRQFERAADRYQEHAVLQRQVEQECLERLAQLELTPRDVLDVGCGPGYATAQLVRRFPRARVVGLDIAPGMLRQQRLGGRWRRGPRLVCADMAALPLAPASFDLLFSSLALQWSDDLDAVLRALHRVLRPGGCLLFSSFGPDTLKELRTAWSAADSAEHVSAFVDLHDMGDALTRAGYRDPVMDRALYTLTYDDVKGVLDDIRLIGAANALQDRPRGLTTPARWRVMVQAYEAFRKQGRLPATYEVNFGVAWRPATDLSPDAGPGEAPLRWVPGRRRD